MKQIDIVTRIPLTTQIRTESLSTGEDIFVAVCPELDIVSQGETAGQAEDNLIEAVSLFIETASPAELKTRLPNNPVLFSGMVKPQIEVGVG